MTLCPIAIAVGCKKCPAFSVCPLKATIGDYRKEPAPSASASANSTAKGNPAGKGK
jgi:hypothetical protein